MSARSGLSAAQLRFLYLSPASRYALLGMRALAVAKGQGSFGLVRDAAKRGGLPANMLAKVFQRLVRSGLLVSQRGPGGGYRLARPASKITLAEILVAVQDILPFGHHCLLRNRLCETGDYCLIHDVIVKADEIVLKGMESLTLEDLAESGGW